MPSETTIDAILFDLDNTLIPFLPPLRRWAQTWADVARPEDPDPVREALLDVTLDGAEDTSRAVRVVADRFDLHDEAEVASREARCVYWRALSPYPGVPGVLHRLEDEVRLGVVTDAPRKRAAVRLSATQLTRRFDVVVTRDETPAGKTSPEPFRLALDELGAEPAQALMVGDWPAFDVRWPNRIGMRSVLASWGSGALPDRARCSTQPWFEAEDPRAIPRAVLDGAAPPTRAPKQTTLQSAPS